LLLLIFEGADVIEDRHALGEHGAAGERKPFLRQIAEGEAFLDGERAGVEAVQARQHL